MVALEMVMDMKLEMKLDMVLICTRNKQRQSKMTSNNDMDVDTNGTRRIAIKRKTPDDGLNEIAKKAKHQSSTFQVVLNSSSMQQNEEKKTFEN
ncbi:hypothetical protein RFI_37837, partial [Reticulomyxa filosa]